MLVCNRNHPLDLISSFPYKYVSTYLLTYLCTCLSTLSKQLSVCPLPPFVCPCICLCVCPCVSPCVHPLTTSTFLNRFVQQVYQWKPHAKRKVLRPFGNKSFRKNSRSKKWFGEGCSYLKLSARHSIYVCLGVKAYSSRL